MGVDMYTSGSALRLNGRFTEEELVATAKRYLMEGGYLESDVYRLADDIVIRDAVSLEGLFAAFNQILVRDKDGQIVGCFGFDDRYIDPRELFVGLAAGLQEGSWYSYRIDEGSAPDGYLLVILEEDRLAEIRFRSEDTIQGITGAEMGTILQGIAERALQDGIDLPKVDDRTALHYLETQQAYQLA